MLADGYAVEWRIGNADVDGDGKIGLAEEIFVLQKTAELRN